MELEYRKIDELNLNEVLELKRICYKYYKDSYLNYWDDEYPSDSLFLEDLKSKNSRGVYLNNELISFITYHDSSYYLSKDDPYFPFTTKSIIVLCRLMVSPLIQNNGVGTFTMTKIVNEIKSNYKDIKKIGLMVLNTNLVAQKIYLKLGFKKIDVLNQEKYDPFITYELDIN